jgi:hypothetical protein
MPTSLAIILYPSRKPRGICKVFLQPSLESHVSISDGKNESIYQISIFFQMIFLDRPEVLAERTAEAVAAVTPGDEVEVIAWRRIERRLQGWLSRIADRARRQAGVDVGVPRGGELEVPAEETAGI